MKIACPKCGANLVFLPDKQVCFCEHCQNEINPKDYYTKEYDVQSGIITWDECTCSSCGAKLIVDEHTVISRCVYCGSTEIIKSRFQGEFKPNRILPFQVTLKGFLNKYQRFIEHQSYVPYAFTEKYVLDDIKGLYVPMYSYKVQVIVQADILKRIEGYRKKVNVNGKEEVQFVNEPKIIHVQKTHEGPKCSILLDGASKIQDRIIEELGPFDYSRLTPFHPMYLCGFAAQNGDETRKWLNKKASHHIEKKVESYLKEVLKDYSYAKGKIVVRQVLLNKELFMIPVWFFNTTYEGDKYYFALNGQTGKIVGKVPVDKKQFFTALVFKAFCIGVFLYGMARIFQIFSLISLSAFLAFPIPMLYIIVKTLSRLGIPFVDKIEQIDLGHIRKLFTRDLLEIEIHEMEEAKEKEEENKKIEE